MPERSAQEVTSCLSLIQEKTNFKEITTLSYLLLLPPNPRVPSRERMIIVPAVRSICRTTELFSTWEMSEGPEDGVAVFALEPAASGAADYSFLVSIS